jgi:hypothetical protein
MCPEEPMRVQQSLFSGGLQMLEKPWALLPTLQVQERTVSGARA